ncbi:MAG: O-phosphoserine--tRNA ligase [Candidatus Lokiarchaeota archaeon]|nr:O-phosphoserine--tRNA ligase [Candidatus Lokiarchaeota archaeon]MBD3198785.1 O-phosphoserine--tRNA ligase [Candidatus Lokiarchaeota archaeon]
MPFDVGKLKREAKKDYENAWLESKNELLLEGDYFSLEKKGKSHEIQDFIEDSRNMLINLGFEELILPMFVEEDEIYKQYGPEAVLILDRLFYLAGLPRPDIGLSNEKINKIRSLIPQFSKIDELKHIFREYKKGEIEADDLIEVFVENLQILESQATEIIDKIFPELKELKPIPTKTTLRSHTTALWFIVLSELKKKKALPLQYFSVAKKFRREQKIDATHLYDSYTLSIVIMADKISLEDCKKIASDITKKLGFKNNKTEIKKATSKYYAPQTEFEIFVEHPTTKEWIEIGDGGFYSPISLAKYDIEYPVFNIGFGVERICMIKSGIEDIRKLVYPYFYEDISFSNKEIAKGIKYKYKPSTQKGIEIRDAIIKSALDNIVKKSPTEISVWEGEVNDKKIEVKIWERDVGVTLLGPAALNEIWIKDGNIIGVPSEKAPDDAYNTEKSYLEGIANEMAYNIEILLDQKKESYEYRVKMCYRASEINLEINDIIMEYIHSNQKKVDIRGPVFIGLSFEVVK